MKWTLFYTFAFLLGVVLAWLGQTFWIGIIILCFVMTGYIFDFLYTLYGTTNLERVEKFIMKKKKEPIYHFVYSQAFGSVEDQLKSIEQILSKYKQPHIRHYYQAIRAYLKEDYQLALQEVEFINKHHIKNYTKAFIYAAMGEKEQSLDIPLEKNWMKEAVLAMIAYKEKNPQSFRKHSLNAIEGAKGIQRYSLNASFNALENQLNHANY